ncbi:C-type lectin domain family 4 member C-like [Gadus macrocephalus]|uniref:C-type lectin domain family 4 member C-like n=1 Tax=Gadus macrocephalus TaxID=80720 RepID=UPI0028CB4078|nr:C-type lectin domain family 4 member C-like [Gadus macrocephalus]
MAEVIYTMPNMMTKARNTHGEREERIGDIYATIESLRDQHQDYVGTEESSNTLGTVRSQQLDPVSPPRCQIRGVVVLLVLLTVVLLAGLVGLAVQHKTISMKVEQLLQRLKNVTEQRDLLTLCNQDCPRYWDKFGCKCYSRQQGSWKKSRELCVSDGADLVVVDSEKEMDFINRYGGTIWLGATDEASDGLWRWVDGTVLSADNPSWGRGKPDGGREKNCLLNEHNSTIWLGVTDKACEAINWGLCEYNLMK